MSDEFIINQKVTSGLQFIVLIVFQNVQLTTKGHHEIREGELKHLDLSCMFLIYVD
mgnify:CR=1 FL=1